MKFLCFHDETCGPLEVGSLERSTQIQQKDVIGKPLKKRCKRSWGLSPGDPHCQSLGGPEPEEMRPRSKWSSPRSEE